MKGIRARISLWIGKVSICIAKGKEGNGRAMEELH
jgi:hypothetical protein